MQGRLDLRQRSDAQRSSEVRASRLPSTVSSFPRDRQLHSGVLDDESRRRARASSVSVSTQRLSRPAPHSAAIPGIDNMGNTCWMGSVLQCLLNIRGLTDVCAPFKRSADVSKRDMGHAFAELLMEYQSTVGRHISVGNLRKAVAAVDSRYAGYRQQDAYEFLGFLLDGLETSLEALRSKGVAGPGAIRAIFGVTSLTTRSCHGCSNRFDGDRVTDLVVRVPLLSHEAQMNADSREREERQPVSLQELLKAAWSPENIEGYDCRVCRTRPSKHGAKAHGATQKSSISETKDVLVIVLFRFCNALDSNGEFSAMKVKRKVSCPTSLSVGSRSYRLCGVVSHIGRSLSAGHYVAAVQSLRDGIWYECDDDWVTRLDCPALYMYNCNSWVSAVSLSADPYILFYRIENTEKDRSMCRTPPRTSGTGAGERHEHSLREHQPRGASGNAGTSSCLQQANEASRPTSTRGRVTPTQRRLPSSDSSSESDSSPSGREAPPRSNRQMGGRVGKGGRVVSSNRAC